MLKERKKKDKWHIEPEEFETPLPPTPITIEAKTRLRRWGVPDEYVERLRLMASLFRYDRCPQKAARISRSGGLLFDDGGTEKIILPAFFDYETRLDGQCGDLASQFIRALNFSGLLMELNEILVANAKPKLLPVYCSGQSKTHFNTDRSIHAWTGLIQENEIPDYQIVVDVSFQQIANLGSSGYGLEKLYINPKLMTTSKGPSICVVPLKLDTNGSDCIKDFSSVVVLGSSRDGKLVYSVGFSRIKGGKFYPFITILREDGRVIETTCLQGDDGVIRWQGRTGDINGSQEIEIRAMLSSLNMMKIERNQSKGANLQKEEGLALVSRVL